jgi:phage terminase large subunit-like protein
MGVYDPATFGAVLGEVIGLLRDPRDWGWAMRLLPAPVKRRIAEEWRWQAHDGQQAPPGEWRIWLIMAGRGFGKTRAGAEWIADRARAHPGARVALVGGSREEVIKVMVEGPSGLLATARSDEELIWVPTRGELFFPSGARAHVYSAAAPGQLRGPEHDFAWADELAKWPRAEETWDNLNMGLRRGERPQLVVTTTPARVTALRRVRAAARQVETGGRTTDNAHLGEAYRDWMEETYAGTRLGRQELDGELIEDVDGSLFPRDVLEAARVATAPELVRVVVGVDPPASVGGDACGIVVCGLGADGMAYVLADCSVSGERPEGWARSVARGGAGVGRGPGDRREEPGRATWSRACSGRRTARCRCGW